MSRIRWKFRLTPLKKMTVDELKEYAATNGIDLGEATKKADILAAIQAAETGNDE